MDRWWNVYGSVISTCDLAARVLATVFASLFSLCSTQVVMASHDQTWKLDPARAALDDMTVTAQVQSGETILEVVVVFSRPNGKPPMPASAVDVQVFDTQGHALALLNSPNGMLPEFGGGLGTSVNARYRFSMRSSPPGRLVVRHGGKEVTFPLIRSATSP